MKNLIRLVIGIICATLTVYWPHHYFAVDDILVNAGGFLEFEANTLMIPDHTAFHVRCSG